MPQISSFDRPAIYVYTGSSLIISDSVPSRVSSAYLHFKKSSSDTKYFNYIYTWDTGLDPAKSCGMTGNHMPIMRPLPPRTVMRGGRCICTKAAASGASELFAAKHAADLHLPVWVRIQELPNIILTSVVMLV